MKKVGKSAFNDWALPAAPELLSFKYGWAFDINTQALCNLVRGREKLTTLCAYLGGFDMISFMCRGWRLAICSCSLRTEYTPIAGLNHVEEMMSGGGQGLQDLLLIELGRSCPHLSTLELSGDLRFTDVGVMALLSGCQELKILKLSASTIFHKSVAGIKLNDMEAVRQAIDGAGLEVAEVPGLSVASATPLPVASKAPLVVD